MPGDCPRRSSGPDHARVNLDAFIEGTNAYLAKVAPGFEPIQAHEMAAGAAYHMAKAGDWGGEELSVYQLASMAKLFRGPEFMCQVINDAIPQNVPCSPTTDHSHRREALFDTVAGAIPPDFNPDVMLAILEDEEVERRYAHENGLMTTWGSFSWKERTERRASENDLLFGAPMVHYHTPSWSSWATLTHRALPVAGAWNCHGAPGVLYWPHERVGLGHDLEPFECHRFSSRETLNPDNQYQYWHNGRLGVWKVIDLGPIQVLEEEGLYEEPYMVYRTVHGPIVKWDLTTHKAYARTTPFRHLELESMMAFLDINMARDLEDVENAVRQVATTHNFFAADVDGNIGYWDSGRFLIRAEGYDDRLPTPGTGEYDWRGFRNTTDEVACINPPEGWFDNWNNKPSVKTPVWFPEGTWAVKIFECLEDDESVTWEEFLAIIRENGENNFLATYFKPLGLEALRSRPDLPPEHVEAMKVLEEWPNKDVMGSPGALLFNEWLAETMVQLFAPDLGVMVSRDMGLDNLRLFATLAFRVLAPEQRCIALQGDTCTGATPRKWCIRPLRLPTSAWPASTDPISISGSTTAACGSSAMRSTIPMPFSAKARSWCPSATRARTGWPWSWASASRRTTYSRRDNAAIPIRPITWTKCPFSASSR